MKYDAKEKWAVDVEILSFDYRVALEDYADEILRALTANGNSGFVGYDEENEDYCRLSIFGDANGDNERLRSLFDELWRCGCSFEYPESVTDDDWKRMNELCGVC